MQLLLKPNGWTCLATSFAMALDVSYKELFARIGHDGSQILAQYCDPYQRRGHHIQECIEAALTLGYSVTPVELFPVLSSPIWGNHVVEFDCNWERFERHAHENRGVITGAGVSCGHAVAFDRGHVYDPDGWVYAFSKERCEQRRFYPQCLWIVREVE